MVDDVAGLLEQNHKKNLPGGEGENILTHTTAAIPEPAPGLHRYVQAGIWAEWIPKLFEAKQFLTLTSREEVFTDTLLRRHGYLLRKINKEVFGNNWSRRGEGISYLVGAEPQKRGVLHLHSIWDASYVPYEQVHSIWNRISGHAWIEPVTATTGVAYYVTKYSVKGGVVDVYLTRSKRALFCTGSA